MASKVIQLPEFSAFPVLEEMEFSALCAEKAELDEMKRTAEARLKELNQQIAAALTCAEVKSVKWNGWRVTQIDGRGPSQLKVERLLEKGVPAEVIEYATVPGKTYTTAQMAQVREGE